MCPALRAIIDRFHSIRPPRSNLTPGNRQATPPIYPPPSQSWLLILECTQKYFCLSPAQSPQFGYCHTHRRRNPTDRHSKPEHRNRLRRSRGNCHRSQRVAISGCDCAANIAMCSFLYRNTFSLLTSIVSNLRTPRRSSICLDKAKRMRAIAIMVRR